MQNPAVPQESARVRMWSSLRPPRRLKFTREGKFFLGITFGVGFAAINTGNNLLFLMLGLLLALMLVSGVMSELSLRELTVVRRLPMRAQVGRPHLVEIEVFNHKGRVPSYAIEVEDLREIRPPPGAESTYRSAEDTEWARSWPMEQMWIARKEA